MRSPGTATLLLLMAELSRRGIVRYDHLADRNPFKERFATSEDPLAELRIVKPTLRYLATSMGDLAERAAAKVARRVKELWPGGQPGRETEHASLPREPTTKL